METPEEKRARSLRRREIAERHLNHPNPRIRGFAKEQYEKACQAIKADRKRVIEAFL
jgi:hypothetical protein